MSSKHPQELQSKPVTRRKPRRVELVSPTYQPTRAELEEPIKLPRLSLEEAARRLLEPVEIHYVEKPRREN